MKKLLVAASFCLALITTNAQTTKMPAVDKSPMDMAYFPANYPVLKIQDKAAEPLVARIIYSRPQKAGRTTFGELVEFGKVWRLGANEATEVDFFREVKIGGKKVPKGTYTLYAVVTPTEWTLIVNKETDTWGAFKYDEKKDVVRTTIPVQKTDAPVEAFTMMFEKATHGANLIMAWDDVKVSLPISTK